MNRSTVRVVACGLCLGLAACSFGPRVVRGNRYAYNMGLHRSNAEELLLNMVRAKYFEPLFFLQVGAVSASFGFSATAGMQGQWDSPPGAGTDQLLGATLGAGYSESPVISYAPLQGEAFAKQMLAEIGLDRLLLLSRAKFSIQSLLWVLVQQIGDHINFCPSATAEPAGLESYGRFLDLGEALGRLEKRGDLECVRMGKDDTAGSYLLLELRYLDGAEGDAVEALLGVKPVRVPDARGRPVAEVRLTPLSDFKGPSEPGDPPLVPVRMKSFYFVLFDLGYAAEAPEADRGRTANAIYPPPTDALNDRRGLHQGLVRIRVADARPADAFLAVPYRGHWFHVGDTDVYSKAYLTLVEILFTLQAGDIPAPVPVLTLPVGK
jgi:hypothetical protein